MRTSTPMKWLKRIAIVLGALLIILIALPFFISLDDYIPRIEKEISARLKEPVSIKSIRFAALPLPHITIDRIAIGKTEDVKVGKVTVTPDLWSLLSRTKVIRSIEIDQLVLAQKAIDRIPAWTKPDGKRDTEPPEPAAVRVESIKLNDALVKLAKATVGPFDAQLNLAGSGELEDAAIVTKDGKVKAFVKPEKAKYRIDASARGWKLPMGPAILFDELDIKGIATMNDANLDQVRAKLYGGSVNGRATIGWQRGLRLKGNFDVNQVELKQLVPLLSPGTNVSGKLNAKPVFSASAAEAGQLMNALRLETPFNVQNGVLHGVDISKAATSLISKEGSKGGETRFDELSGHLVADRGAYRLTQLKIASGVLAADGNVNISSRKELSGRINAQLKAVGTTANVPLNVAGTLDSPLLYPTGGTMTGAAVGTAILGPGLGTSVGAKAGQFVEKLFGGQEKKKP